MGSGAAVGVNSNGRLFQLIFAFTLAGIGLALIFVD